MSVCIDLKQPTKDVEKPVFIKTWNSRYHKELWAYSKLVDASSPLCLCTYCVKSDIPKGVICSIHDKFMRMTEEMGIAAPIFACPEFVELENAHNYFAFYYDGDTLSSDKVGARIPEIRGRAKEQWKAQKELWSSNGSEA